MNFFKRITLAVASMSFCSQLQSFEIEQDSGQLIVNYSAVAKEVNYQYKLPSGCNAKVKVEKTASKLQFSHLGHCSNGAVLTVDYPANLALNAVLGAGRLEVRNVVLAETHMNRFSAEATVGTASVPPGSDWNLVKNNWVGRTYEKIVRNGEGPEASFVVNSGVINVSN